MAARKTEGSVHPQEWIRRLRQPPSISGQHPVSARFIYSLRLVAIHRRAGRDPTAELATRLGSVAVAVKALQLIEGLCRAWPEPINLNRFCCQALSHDEATISVMVDAAWRNRPGEFTDQLAGLLRPDRIDRLWSDAIELVASEAARA